MKAASPDVSSSLAAEGHASSGLRKEGILTVLLGIAVVLAIMNTSMFNLALPEITDSFGLSASVSSLIVTGYSIMFAISSITYSRLSDFVPLRRLLVIGLLTLGIAALGGLFSPSFWLLLTMRVLQAVGAGAVISLSMVLFTRYIPIERRGKAMAFIMSAVSLGLGLGPVAGGAIVDYFGWRYLFLVTAISLLLVPLLYLSLPRETPKRGVFDTAGAVFLAVGTSGILLFLTSHSWPALAAGVVGLVLFVLRIRLASEPFVQPALFANSAYVALSLVGILSYLCSFATLFLIPQILVHRFDFSASHAGFIIFPGSLLAIVASRKVGTIIDRHGNLHILRYAPLLVLCATLLFALFAADSWLAILLIYLLISLSFTMLSSSVSNEISRILPASQVGSGMGLFQLLQFFSGAFSVAIASSAMEWQKGLSLSSAYSNIFWGLMIMALLAFISSYVYLRSTGSLKSESKSGSLDR
ncbi:tetracycline resistance protein TetA [Paenibacillus yonginensis]|uniref:Tetracycline resistance protein TetA n=1 Tax=Paenibacillus yonginensis TaxID=1462996 RepID=A0A1B1MVZ2_9BACL|nr:MFS transporter [Paenibacillus yonginensis]ANS73353.1 tetracycline resistance protein TetA [Paenibacillus yonginensis]